MQASNRLYLSLSWSLAGRQDLELVSARCTRKDESPRVGSNPGLPPVLLMSCWAPDAERKAMVQQLRRWSGAGYQWGEMAVLCRTNQQV